MILSISSQIKLFLYMFLSGVISRIIYDFIRATRRVFSSNLFIINLQDFFYWILNSIVIFFILLSKSYGEVRFFSIFGIFLGMIVYSIILSKLVIIFFVNLLIMIIKTFLLPIKYFLLLYKKINITVQKHTNSVKKYLYKIIRYAKFKKNKFIKNISIIFKKI